MKNTSKLVVYGLLLALLTFLFFLQTIFYELTSWDDDVYITENIFTKELSTKNIRDIFLSRTLGQYTPLTILSFAVDNKVYNGSSYGFHLSNVVLHSINTILIYFLFVLIFESPATAFMAALIFALHPMKVEVVAWATARKDLLAALFYLAAIICYCSFLNNKKLSFYIITFIFALLALLSKPQSVGLPLVFLAIDYYQQSKINWRLLIEKLPFFFLSASFGMIAIYGINQMVNSYGFVERILLVLNALFVYILKFFLPINLSPIYPYPTSAEIFHHLFLIKGALALVAVLLWLLFSNQDKKFIFGLCFFIMAIFPALPFTQFGIAFAADRFTYLASFGLIISLITFLLRYRIVSRYAYFILAIYIIFFAIQTNKQLAIWQNGISLFNTMLKYSPNFAPAYSARGKIFYLTGREREALEEYNKAIYFDPQYEKAYYNRGLLFLKQNEAKKAIQDFSSAIALKPDYAEAYYNRAIALESLQLTNEAIADYLNAIKSNPALAEPYNNLAILQAKIGLFEEAIQNFNKFLARKPNSRTVWHNLGLTYLATSNINAAKYAFEKAKYGE